MTGCGRDYYYVGSMDVEGDALIVHFLDTCPDVRVVWDGTFHDAWHVDLAVLAHGDSCSDDPRVSFDLRSIKWTVADKKADQFWGVTLRIAGADADREPS